MVSIRQFCLMLSEINQDASFGYNSNTRDGIIHGTIPGGRDLKLPNGYYFAQGGIFINSIHALAFKYQCDKDVTPVCPEMKKGLKDLVKIIRVLNPACGIKLSGKNIVGDITTDNLKVPEGAEKSVSYLSDTVIIDYMGTSYLYNRKK